MQVPVEDSHFDLEQAWELLYGDVSSTASETPTQGEYLHNLHDKKYYDVWISVDMEPFSPSGRIRKGVDASYDREAMLQGAIWTDFLLQDFSYSLHINFGVLDLATPHP